MPQMPDEIKVNFTLLQGRILRMENLINGILDYSRIGKENLPYEKVSIKLLLNQIIDNLVPLDRFDVHIDENMPVVFNAKILVDQVFSNIISNAIKYNDKEKGKIEFFYQELADLHEFTIRDNRPGISEKYQEKVFGVFQTIEARDIIESTGIGLSIVKKIIEGKNGKIAIDSNYNQGASFVFTLPK
jgi:signal transduction histidine kinase